MFTVVTPERVLRSQAWLESLDYRLLTTEREILAWIESIPPGATIGADWETDRLNRFTGPKMVGLGLATAVDRACYIPIRHTVDSHLNVSEGFVREVLQKLDAAKVETVWHNYMFDGGVMVSAWGWEPEHWQDSMVASWVWDPTQTTLGLKPMTRRLLGRPVLEFEGVTAGRTFGDLSPMEATAYVCGDASNTLGIWQYVMAQAAFQAQRQVYTHIERPFLPVLRDEIAGGVAINVPYLDEVASTLGAVNEDDVPVSGLLKATYDEVQALAGGINLNSPQQIGRLLESLGVPIKERTDTGAVATGKEVLAQYNHPVCQSITRYRQVLAAKRNYVDKLRHSLEHFGSPWLRFQYRQCGAPTGRMACGGDGESSDVVDRALLAGYTPINAQAIPDPSRRPDLPNLRKIWVPYPVDDPAADEWVWVAADESQIELRVAAALSGEKAMVDAFNNDEDIHETNGRLAYGDAYTPDKRKQGKTMGFATLFQAGDDTVASHGGITLEEASRLTTTFKARTPQLQQQIERWKSVAREYGYAQTFFGRRRPLSAYFGPKTSYAMRAQGERFSVNTPVQGTAADIFKIACVKAHKACRERGWGALVRQVAWVHDELGFRVHRSVLEEVLPVLQASMEFPIKGWPVKLKVEIGHGASWGDAK
jgi:DNA polymerase-1